MSIRKRGTKGLLRVPQARVLAALMPADPSDPAFDWPTLSRAILGVRAGYTAISGTITRALNGIQPGSSSGSPYLGLLTLRYIEETVFDIDGVREMCYRATPAGQAAYQAYITAVGSLPRHRDKELCVNDRYRRPEQS